MVSARGALATALTGLGLLGVLVGVTLAQSIEQPPPGGGDVPHGFALLFAWGVADVSAGVVGLGALLLDDTGPGYYLRHWQRRLVQAGGGCLLVAAVAPLAGLLLLPVFYGVLGPGAPGDPNALLSTLVVAWLVVAALGVLGIGGGVLWRVGDAVRAAIRGQFD